jgi:hypothetical protein
VGLGEFGGNGSVVWRAVHEDDQGNPKNLTHVPGGGEPGNDQVRVGSPGTGQPPRAGGKDAIPVADIGRRKGHTGKFRVKLRYLDQAAATDAKNTARITTDGNVWFVEIDVEALNRPNINANQPLEVKVDW